MDEIEKIIEASWSADIPKIALHEIKERAYAIGYRRGVQDQRKTTLRVKYRYKILVDWLISQLQKFAIYTLRREYKQIITDIVKISESYIFENRLNSSYVPSGKYNYNINGQKFETTFKDELSLLLVDKVQEFIDEEESKKLN